MAEQEKTEPAKPRRPRKKARAHAGHHGGAWKVAYADFVTAMMALFLVLWLVSQADVKVKQAIANYFRSPGVFDTLQGGILAQAKKVSKEPEDLTSKDDEQQLFNAAQKLKEQFSTRTEFSKYKDQIKVEITDEGLRIQLIDKAERVSFASGSADLTVDARAILAEVAAQICSLPNKINIGGHTDSRVFPSDNGYTNWELSTDRANAARRVLETVCVKPEQIHRIIGFADTELTVANDPYAPSNRRISITVLRLTPADAGKEPGDASPPNDETIKPANKIAAKTVIGEKSPAKQPAAPDESEKPPENSEKPPPSDKSPVKEKLLKEGSVKVGEPDEVPAVPKIKEKPDN